MNLADEPMTWVIIGAVVLSGGSFIIFFIADFISFLKTGKFKSKQ